MKPIIVLILCAVMLSCCASDKKKYNSPKKVEQSTNIGSDRLLKNVSGVILEKHENTYTGDYFFTIELSNGKVFDWETTRAKFVQKDKGDAVFFEYIRKDRFSDKAID